jgi:glyoxylase I family protein
MKITMHHRNFSTNNVEAMAHFYKDVLGLTENMEMRDVRILNQYSGDTRFLMVGDGQIHISQMDCHNGFKTGHHVNPLLTGHLGFRVDDIEELKERLRKHNVPFSDIGEWAIKGWYQIFLYDPDGNVIEVQHVNDAPPEEHKMNIQLHHKNYSTNNVEEMASFYMNVLGLTENMEMRDGRILNQYSGDTRFLMAENGQQIHISQMDRFNGFTTGHHVNPLLRGHLGFRVDDIEGLKERLSKHKVPFSDIGEWAIKGWYQIFLYDPDGNVLEVQQVKE